MAAALEPADIMAASDLEELSPKTCADKFAGDTANKARLRKAELMQVRRDAMNFLRVGDRE
jgi:hypothetical protein